MHCIASIRFVLRKSKEKRKFCYNAEVYSLVEKISKICNNNDDASCLPYSTGYQRDPFEAVVTAQVHIAPDICASR